jgi:hypothetical protein
MRASGLVRIGAIVMAALAPGCGAAGVPPGGPATPAGVAGAAPANATSEPTGRPSEAAGSRPAADPFAIPDGVRDDAPIVPPPPAYPIEAWKRASAAVGIAALPKACAAFASRAPAKPAPADLVSALAEPDAARRDALLVAREGAEAPGLVRALRAELAPTECADAIVDPFLKTASANALATPHAHAVVGLSLAAKLARTALAPPTLSPGAGDKQSVKKFVTGPLRTWVVQQATAIEMLGAGAAGLVGYGRGIAAIEAGHADLRLVDQLRSAPVPKTWDAELRSVYEVALDEALEPRKQRGRDAVLVGLSDLSDAGVTKDVRVARARALLSKLYAGRLVDALDALLLPTRRSLDATGPLARAASALPVFWVDTLGGAFDALDPAKDMNAWAAVLATRGLPRGTRAAMRPFRDLQPELLRDYAQARLELARVSFRRVDAVEAAHAWKQVLRATKMSGDPDRLALAVALAIASGPDGTRELMTSPAKLVGYRETVALDAVAAAPGHDAQVPGLAAFDAAHFRALAARSLPAAEASAAWMDVAARFRNASSLLDGPAAATARERAADAEEAAKLVLGGKR